MSTLKINENLFLEKAELNRLVRFLTKDGYKQDFIKSMEQPGLLRNDVIDIAFDNFFVRDSGVLNTIHINPGIAYDKDGNVIFSNEVVPILLPQTNTQYYVKIRYRSVPFEVGTVTVGVDGLLTGTGTLFTEVLRGQPNFAARIKFYTEKINGVPTASTINPLEYDITSVTDDFTAILSGTTFTAETNLYYSVVGTFTPGYIVPPTSKEIFQYDNVLIELDTVEAISGPNTDLQFLIATVNSNGVSIETKDRRQQFYHSRSENLQDNLENTFITSHVGINRIEFDGSMTPQSENKFYMKWGFLADAYSISTVGDRKITITGGSGGGIWVNPVSGLDINNERLYIQGKNTYNPTDDAGKYIRIVSGTSVSPNNYDVTLETLNENDFSNDESLQPEFLIVPDAEEIEFSFQQHPAPFGDPYVPPIIYARYVFPINEKEGCCPVTLLDPTGGQLRILYRFKTFKHYTQWNVLDGATYDDYTTIPAQTGVIYGIDPVIQLNPASTTYKNFNLGDVMKVWYKKEFVASDFAQVNQLTGVGGLKKLTVGVDEQWQVFRTNLNGAPIAISGTYNHFIILDKTGVREGNKWVLDFKMLLDIPNDVQFYVIDGYVTGAYLTAEDELNAQKLILNVKTIWDRFNPGLSLAGRAPLNEFGFCALFVYDSDGIPGTTPQWRVRHFSEPEAIIDVMTQKYLYLTRLSDVGSFGIQDGDTLRYNATTKIWDRYQPYYHESTTDYQDPYFSAGRFFHLLAANANAVNVAIPNYQSLLYGNGVKVEPNTFYDDSTIADFLIPFFRQNTPAKLGGEEIVIPTTGKYRLKFTSNNINLFHFLTDNQPTLPYQRTFHSVFLRNATVQTPPNLNPLSVILDKTYNVVTYDAVAPSGLSFGSNGQNIPQPTLVVRHEGVVDLVAGDIINVCGWHHVRQLSYPGGNISNDTLFTVLPFGIGDRTLSVERIS